MQKQRQHARLPGGLTCVAKQVPSKTSGSGVHPGLVSLGTTHGWVEGRAAEAQWLWTRPSCHGPCSGLSRSPSAPVTLFYGPAKAAARKSALGCRKIAASPLLSPSWGHLSELIRPPFPQSSSQRWGQGWATVGQLFCSWKAVPPR